jgi:TRAP-type mannitol/chloroaromatic compound transport system substrate-binding protein
MKRNKLLVLISCLLLVILLVAVILPACTTEEEPTTPTTPTTPTEAEEEVYEFKWQTSSWPGHRSWELTEDIVNRIEAMSNGRIKIEMYEGGAIAAVREMFDAMSEGAYDFGSICTCWIQGNVPVGNISWGLVGGPDYFHEKHDLYIYQEPRSFSDVERDAYMAAGNVYVIHATPTSHNYGQFMSTVPINCMEDTNGLKIRSFGMTGRTWEANGGSIVTVAPGEEYTALALGTIDCANRGGPSLFYDLGLHEVCPYFIRSPIGDSGSTYCMNLDRWNELPEDVKSIFWNACFFAQVRNGDDTHVRDIEKLQVMVNDWGTTIIDWPQEEFDAVRSVAIPLYAELGEELNDPYYDECYQLLVDYLTKMGYSW